MKRRSLFTLAGDAALMLVAEPADAQQPVLPRIGSLSNGSPAQWAPLVAAFRDGLGETGLVDGTNVAIEFRWAVGREDRLPALAADLVQRRVAVRVATGGPSVALAARAATATFPIVFTLGADPVRLGLVATLGRPGGNATGATFITGQLHAKRLELLRELVPKARQIALLVNPDNPLAEANVKVVQDAARSLEQPMRVLQARGRSDIDTAFADLAAMRAGALLVGSDVLFYQLCEQVVALCVRGVMPASFDQRDAVALGGLMSCGASLAPVYAQAGRYSGKILNGAKPADLSVLQPTKIELVINRRTARMLGLSIPQSLLLRADEVIQ